MVFPGWEAGSCGPSLARQTEYFSLPYSSSYTSCTCMLGDYWWLDLYTDATPLESIARSWERSWQIQSTGRATTNLGAVGMSVAGEGEVESAPRKSRPLCPSSPCVLHVLCIPSSASSRTYTLARSVSLGGPLLRARNSYGLGGLTV